MVIGCGPWFTETTNHLSTMRTQAGTLRAWGVSLHSRSARVLGERTQALGRACPVDQGAGGRRGRRGFLGDIYPDL